MTRSAKWYTQGIHLFDGIKKEREKKEREKVLRLSMRGFTGHGKPGWTLILDWSAVLKPFWSRAGELVGESAELVTDRLQVWIPAGEFSSPELTQCTGSYLVFVPSLVTAVAHKKTPRSFCQKCRWQVTYTPKHAYTFDPTESKWAD